MLYFISLHYGKTKSVNFLPILFLLWILSFSAFPSTPLLSFDFNDSGTTSLNSGSLNTTISSGTLLNSTGNYDYHGSSASGVSGLVGDIALNLSASDAMGSSASTTGGVLKINSVSLGTLISFTITGWFKADEVINSVARIIESSTIGLYGTSSGKLRLNINGTTLDSTTSYSDVGSWVFFAVTYDGSLINFYAGSSSTTAYLAYSASATYGTISTSSSTVCVGNSSALNRPFDGLLDNIALYGSTDDTSGALTLSSIQAIQASAIPEPNILTMIILCVILFIGFTKIQLKLDIIQ